MNKLQELIAKCKCGVYLSINEHRDEYLSVKDYFEDGRFSVDDLKDIEPSVYEKMKEANTIIELQFYPDTPVGFYMIYHYDLEKALDEALKLI